MLINFTKTRKRRFTSALALALIFALLLSSFPLNLQPVQAAMQPGINGLTITGDGVDNELFIPLAELLAMPTTEQYYSAYNTFPTAKHIRAQGLWLEDLLALAGLKEDAKNLIFRAADGAFFEISLNYLLNEELYYYPNILTGSEEGRLPVKPMLAVLYAEPHNSTLTDTETPRLCFGQNYFTEQAYNDFAKYVNKIEVTTEDKGQYSLPKASLSSGPVEQGTEINLTTDEGKGAKIYYTLDGTEPDRSSPIFNLSDWSINPPITIYGDLGETITIKAKIYGNTREPSEVATFVYTISDNPRPMIILSEPKPGQVYYPESTVTISGKALNMNQITMIGVNDPLGNTVYSQMNVNPEANGDFKVSFTLAANAELGFYTVTLFDMATSASASGSFQVKEDAVINPGPNDGSRPDMIFTSFNSNGVEKSRVIQARIMKDTDQTKLIAMEARYWDGQYNTNGRLNNWSDLKGMGGDNGVVTALDTLHSLVKWNLSALTIGVGSRLEENTTYVAQVGSNGHWSEAFFFTTGNVDQKAPFSFMYLGDVQEGYGQWGKMIRDTYTAHPEIKLGLIGGDLVENGDDNSEWEAFLAEASTVFSDVIMAPVPGNHDNGELFYKYLRGIFPGSENASNAAMRDVGCYSFDYGNAHFTLLNSNLMSVPGVGSYNSVMAWLKNDLQNAAAKQWRFVVMHYPPYPVMAGDNYNEQNLQNYWAPVFEENGVDVVFVGHQHAYARTKPMLGGEIKNDPSQGVVYIMGNSGSKYYEVQNYDYVDVSASNVSNYQVIHIDGKEMAFNSYDRSGNVIDSFVYEKEPDVSDLGSFSSPVAGSAVKAGAQLQISGSILGAASVIIAVLDSQNQVVYSANPAVSAGSFSSNYNMPSRLPAGEYRVVLTVEGMSGEASVSFNVEAGEFTDPAEVSFEPGFIKTFAGVNEAGYSGDSGPARLATLNLIRGTAGNSAMATDAKGNLFICDTGNNRIRVIPVTDCTLYGINMLKGNIYTVAGAGVLGFAGDGGPATVAKLRGPGGVSFDSAGNMYIADTSNNRIRKVDASGIISTVAGTGTGEQNVVHSGKPALSANLYYPKSVIADAEGNLFFVTGGSGNRYVYMLPVVNCNKYGQNMTAGNVYVVMGNGVNTTANTAVTGANPLAVKSGSLTSLALDSEGNLYAGSGYNYSVMVRKVNVNTGEVTAVAGAGSPIGMTAAAAATGIGGPALEANIHNIESITIDSDGNLFIATSGYQVYKVNKLDGSGIITLVAGISGGSTAVSGDGDAAILSVVGQVVGLAVGEAQNVLYISSASNNSIRMVNLDMGENIALEDISVTTLPDKTIYDIGETLDLTGMVVTASYSDKGTQAVTDYTTNPVNGAVMNTAGAVTVDISYTENSLTATTSFTVQVGAPDLDSISISAKPNKTVYMLGENLDLTGLVVEAKYSDGSTKSVTGYSTIPVNGAALNKGGVQTVSVIYTEKSLTKRTDFPVQVGESTGEVSWIPEIPDGYTDVIIGGANGTSPDGTPVDEALLTSLNAVKFDPQGNLYFTAGRSLGSVNAIRMAPIASGTYFGKEMKAGHVYTVAGGFDAAPSSYPSSSENGLATDFKFQMIYCMDVDKDGNVYFSCGNNSMNWGRRVFMVPNESGEYFGQPMTAGYVYVIAGTNTAGWAGDGGPATASLIVTTDITTDSNGNLYLSDTIVNSSPTSYHLRMIPAQSGTYFGQAMTAGNIYTIAGNGASVAPSDAMLGGPATAVSLVPGMTAVDGEGNLYVSASGNVYKIDNNGIITRFAPFGGSIAFTPDGSLYIGNAVATGGYLRRVAPDGSINVIAGAGTVKTGPAQNTSFSAYSLAADGDGNLYFHNENFGNAVYSLKAPNTVPVMSEIELVYEGSIERVFEGEPFTIDLSEIAVNFTYPGVDTSSLPVAWSIVSGPGSVSGKILTVLGPGNVVLKASVIDTTATYEFNITMGTVPDYAFEPGFIKTLTGNGTAGYSGDGGEARWGMLNLGSTSQPVSARIATDASGNLYITDTGNNRIRVVAAKTGTLFGVDVVAGSIYTIAGTGEAGTAGNGGPALAAKLNGPSGICFDSAGNLYFGEYSGYTIRKVDTNGIVTAVAGTGATSSADQSGKTALEADLGRPSSVTADLDGNIYFLIGVGTNNRFVYMLPAADCDKYGRTGMKAGNVYRIFGTGATSIGSGTATGANPLNVVSGVLTSIALDSAGNLYVSSANPSLSLVRKVDVNTGVVITVAGTGDNNTGTAQGLGGLATSSNMGTPNAVAIDSENNLYITTNSRQVLKVDALDGTGAIMLVAGTGANAYAGDGAPATAAAMGIPGGLAIDEVSGILYIVASGNHNIRMVNLETGTTTEPTYFTITFDYNDGVTEATVEDVEDGKILSQPTDPVREGYEFLGWFADDATEPFDFATAVTGNITLTAHWQPITSGPATYTVTFLDWDGALLDEQQVAEGQDAVAPAEPAREGYTFTGWSIDFSNVTEDLNVFAQYEMIPVIPEVIKDELAALVTAAYDLDPEGYTGDSWTAFSVALSAAQTILGDDNATQVEVDGARDDLQLAISKLEPIETEIVIKDALAALVAAADALDSADYTTASWSAFADALSTAKAVLGDSEATQGEVNSAADDLQATQSALVALVLSEIRIASLPENGSYTAGETLDLTGLAIEAAYNDGSVKSVTGYTTNPAAGAVLYTVGEQTVTVSYTEQGVTQTVDFTVAVSAAPVLYTVTFNYNYTDSPASVTSLTDAMGKLSGLPEAPVRAGYAFGGWFTAASGGDSVTAETVFAKNTTVYAKWAYNGGSGSGKTYAGITANPMSDVTLPVEFTVSLRGTNGATTVAFTFEADGNMLTPANAEALNGFSLVEAINWTDPGDGKLKGTLTLVYKAGTQESFTSAAPVDVLKLVFDAQGLGDATVKLTGMEVSGIVEMEPAWLDSAIEVAEATTSVEEVTVYSVYDLNKDGVVDQLDLTVVVLYCQYSANASDWETALVMDRKGAGVTAKMCDFNEDGAVNMLDLAELFLNYTGK